VILYVATRLNLNKVVAVNVQHFCAPPFVPALCIEVGYYLRHGRWLTDLTWATFTRGAPARVWEWVIGSFVVAPVLAVLAGALAYGAARAFRGRDAGRDGTPPAAERSRGPRLGIAFFRILLATLGLRPAYSLLNLVCLHYLLFDAPARTSSLAYIRRRFPELGPWGRFWAAHRLLVSQGVILVDRYYQESGSGSFEMELKGYAETAEAAGKSGKGFVLLTSHVGSWQVAMAALGRMGKTVHLLMKPEANPAVKEAFGLSQGADRVRIISPDGHLGGVLECIKALDAGDVVAIMGDRSYGAETVETGFLGGRVGFPYGAFSIASAARVPVVVLLSARTGYRRYLVDFSRVIVPGSPGRAGRAENLARCVREYAGILEEYVAQYPYQWFVFYDIWEHGARDAAAGPATTKETTRNAG
jgi:predicted LPLAT superfamily acyltransferase